MADYAFDVGDVVMVKRDLPTPKFYDDLLYFASGMEKYCGKETIIGARYRNEYGANRYRLNIDGGCYVWGEEMLTGHCDSEETLDDSGFEEFFSDFLGKNTAT